VSDLVSSMHSFAKALLRFIFFFTIRLTTLIERSHELKLFVALQTIFLAVAADL